MKFPNPKNPITMPVASERKTRGPVGTDSFSVEFHPRHLRSGQEHQEQNTKVNDAKEPEQKSLGGKL
jgi:hypothetical protein